MATSSGLLKCLICGLNNCNNADQLRDSFNESSIISKHLQVIFLLRNILEVPSSKLVVFLKSHPNLESWLSVCDKCREMVNHCKFTYEAILDAQRKFRNVKQKVVQVLKKSALIKREINYDDLEELHDKPLDIVEEIRGFVHQNQYPKNVDPFISGDERAYQHLSKKLDKVIQKLQEEDGDIQLLGSNDDDGDLQENLDDEWSPPENEEFESNDQPESNEDLHQNDNEERVPSSSEQASKPSSSPTKISKKPPRNIPKNRSKPEPPSASRRKWVRGTYSCHLCPKSFPYEKYLERHIKTLHELCDLCECDMCGASFANVGTLNQHKKSKCTGESLPCPVPGCTRKLSSQPSITNHILYNHSQDDFYKHLRTCKYCGRVLTTISSLRHHIRAIHETNETFKCDLCGVGKTNEPDFLRHQKKCKGNSLSCPVADCQMKFSIFTALSKHVKIHHKDKMDEILPFKCTICKGSMSYLTEKQLKGHMASRHPHKVGERFDESLGPFICETCGDTHPTKFLMQRHRRTSMRCKRLRGEVTEGVGVTKTEICDICGAAFSTRGYLGLHVRTVHEKKFTMKCEICGKGKNGKARMDIHMWHKHKVGDEAKWRCGVDGCTVQIFGKRDREDHMKRHRGEEPSYRCGVCGKGFYMRVNIRQHVREVHEGKRCKRGKGGES